MKFCPGFLFLGVLLAAFGGCARDQALERINREQAQTIHSLKQELNRVNAELEE